MYSDLVNNIKDRAVDSVIDSTLTSFKDNQILNKTFVWTAISKETYNGKIAYIIFINKNMYRRSVQYDALANFCLNNYVSNILVTDGKVSVVGGTFNDLPDIHSNYNRYTEQDIYNRALTYIQSTQAKIYEDFQNKCLKGVDQSEVKSNFSENLSNVKDIAQAGANIAQAGAVTAMTVAGTAVVKGIATGATKIYKAANKKELIKIQMDIYRQLNTCYNMVEGLITIKQLTNNSIQRNINITQYDIEMELRNDTTGQFNNLIRQNGINGCIQRLENIINQSLAKAEGHKILDEPIVNEQGKKAGTLRAYGDSTKSRLELLKQLHIKTEQILNYHRATIEQERQRESERRYLESQQPIIIANIRNQINNIETQLNDIKSKDISIMGIEELEHTLNIINGLDIEYVIESVNIQLGQVLDINIRNEFISTIQDMNNSINNLTNTLSVLINNTKISEQNKINSEIMELSREVEKVISGLYTGEQMQLEYNNIKTKLSELKLRDKTGVHLQELNKIENRINTNERQIQDSISKANKDTIAVNEVREKIHNFDIAISNCDKAKDIEREISRFNQGISYKLSYIKSIDLQNQIRNEVEQKKTEANQLLERLIQKENEDNTRKEEQKIELLNEIRSEIQRITEVDEATLDNGTLSEFKIDKDGYKDRIDALKLDLTTARPLKDAYDNLIREYNKKYRKAEEIINRDIAGTESMKMEILKIRNSITELDLTRSSNIIDINKKSIEKKINSLSTNIYISKLRDKSWVYIEMENLKQELDNKVATGNIN